MIGGSLDFEPLASVRSLAPYESLGDSREGGGKEESVEWQVESPLPFARRFCAAASWRRAVGQGKDAQEAVFVLGGAGRFHFADRSALCSADCECAAAGQRRRDFVPILFGSTNLVPPSSLTCRVISSAINDLSFASVQSYDAQRRTWVNHTGQQHSLADDFALAAHPLGCSHMQLDDATMSGTPA